MVGATVRVSLAPQGLSLMQGVSPALARWTPGHSRLALSRKAGFQCAISLPRPEPCRAQVVGWKEAEPCPPFRLALLPLEAQDGQAGTGGHQTQNSG